MDLSNKLKNCIAETFKDYTPPTWDVFYMRLVYEIAKKSKDTSTKIAALIVGQNNEPISFGYNGMPRGVKENIHDQSDRYQRPKKYMFFEHGERNAILSVARVGGASLLKTKMYTQGIPCADCGRAIIQAGISEVIIHEPFELISRHLYSNWEESSDISLDMFSEAKVSIRYLSDLIGVVGYVRGYKITV